MRRTMGTKKTSLAATAAWIVGGCICLALSVLSSAALDRAVPAAPPAAEFWLFPKGKTLSVLGLGNSELVADLCWLAAVQYYGKHRLTDRRYPLAEHLFDVIVQADPLFEGAYLFGALVLAEEGRIEEAAGLLARGVEAREDSWRLPFELGFLHYVFRRDWEAAGRMFVLASQRPGAPEYVRRFAAAAYEYAGNPFVALGLWRAMERTTANEEIRRLAREHIERLEEQIRRGSAAGNTGNGAMPVEP